MLQDEPLVLMRHDSCRTGFDDSGVLAVKQSNVTHRKVHSVNEGIVMSSCVVLRRLTIFHPGVDAGSPFDTFEEIGEGLH